MITLLLRSLRAAAAFKYFIEWVVGFWIWVDGGCKKMICSILFKVRDATNVYEQVPI